MFISPIKLHLKGILDILKRNLKKASKLGFDKFNVGVEPEFFLFKLDSEGHPQMNLAIWEVILIWHQ